mgnify:CR=1 FL=1
MRKYINWKTVCIAIVLLGIALRTANLGHKFYWDDEVRTAIRISGYLPQDIVEEMYNGAIVEVSELDRFKFPNAEKDMGDAIAALSKHPEHPPLYYILNRVWVQVFGNSIAVIRSLPVLLSLLGFPCLYWLGKELFQSPKATWFAMAIVAISPLHILYAQEAREYSIWTTTILLSSAALLRAVRVNTIRSWGIYTVTAILGFYSHFLFGAMAIAQGIYVWVMENDRPNVGANGVRPIKTYTRQFLFSIAIAILVFSPWIFVTFAHLNQIDRVVSTTSDRVELFRLINVWFRSLNRVFFSADLGSANIIIVLVALHSIYFTYRHAPKRIWLFLLGLVAIHALIIMGPDLILGGTRSTRIRYLTPAYLGMQLTIAYFFAQQFIPISRINATDGNCNVGANAVRPIQSVMPFSKNGINGKMKWRHRSWRMFAIVAVTASIIASSIDVTKEVTWNKGDDNARRYLKTAEIVNSSPQPLVISDASLQPGDPNVVYLLNLSYNLDDRVKLQLVRYPNTPEIPDGFSNIYLFRPSPELAAKLQQDPAIALVPIIDSSSFPVWEIVAIAANQPKKNMRI